MSSAMGRLRGRTHFPFGKLHDLAQSARMWRPTLRCIHDGAFPLSDSSSAAVAGSKSKNTQKDHAGPVDSGNKIRRVYWGPDDSSKAKSISRAPRPDSTRVSPKTSRAPGRSTKSEVDGEDLYRSWLTRRMTPLVPRPCKGLFNDEIPSLEARVPTHLQKDPLLAFTQFSEGTDIATAQACLRLYIARLGKQAGSRQEDFRKLLEESQAGIKALSWFLKSGHYERVESMGVGLINAMAFCTIGGRSTSLWWELMEVKHMPKPLDNTGRPNEELIQITRHRWGNALLRGLIETQAYWSAEEAKMFNEPLASFIKAKCDIGPRVSISGAYGWLVGNLPIADKKGIDVGLYDGFLATTSNYATSSIIESSIEKGLLELMHPTRLDPARLLHFFCDPALEPERMQVLDIRSSERFKFTGMRLAQHLHRAGRTAEARAVMDSAVEVLRRGRRPSVVAAPRGRGKFIKRKATKIELDRGRKVDENGYVVPVDLVNDLERQGNKALYPFESEVSDGRS